MIRSFFSESAGVRVSRMKGDDMNPRPSRLMLVALILFFGAKAAFAAETQSAAPREWDKTVAAARKEGRLNLYVGRYGTEPLLNEFRKEYPDIKISSVNGQGSQLGTRILA